MAQNVVYIAEGAVAGGIKKDLNNQNFYSFQGIPYGEPPVGELRFKAPVPVKPWKGVLPAVEPDEGNIFKRLETKKDPESGKLNHQWVIGGGENCLKLNVYTRELPKCGNPQLKPVMVFIHGGAFVIGNSLEYGPEALITEDVVLVTIHYRLGALGFLVLDDPELGVTGNAGLKDMVLALKWVQRNIAAFHGNPDNVTIFGHSAGGASVNYLLLSPSATGLFHKAILQSGCVLCHWARGDRKNGLVLAKSLGCTKTETKDILKFLQDLPAEKLYQGQLDLKDNTTPSTLRYFSPVVESKNSKEPFLTEEPVDLLKSGKFAKVPIMAGYTDMEYLPFVNFVEESPFNYLCFEEEVLPPVFLRFEKGCKESKQLGKKIRDFYFGDKKPEPISIPAIVMGSDQGVIRGIIKLTQHLSKASSPVFLYRMRTPMDNKAILPNHDITGVPHGGELTFLFKSEHQAKLLSGKEEILQKQLLRLWTNFAKYGNPTPKKDDVIPVLWKPVKENELNFLDIEDELTVDANPEKERMAFWDDIFKSYPQAEGY